MGTHSFFGICRICKNRKAYAWEESGGEVGGAHCYECGYRWYSEDYEVSEDLVTLDEINHMNWNGKKEFYNLTPEEYENRIKKYGIEHLLTPLYHLKDASGPTCYDYGMSGKKRCGYCNWFKNLNKAYCLNWINRNPMEVKE